MLMNLGIPIRIARESIKKNCYYDFESVLDKIIEIQNENDLLRGLHNTFRFTDINTPGHDQRYTGFVDTQTVVKKMQDHGMTDEEMYLFLTPYRRADGKIEYARLLQETFPKSYTPEIVEVFEMGVQGEATISVPRIGRPPDRVKYSLGVSSPPLVKLHMELQAKIQAAVKSWDPDAVEECINLCVGPEYPDRFKLKKETNAGSQFPPAVIKACLTRMEKLRGARHAVARAVSNGSVKVDETTREVTILKPIEFAHRTPPDDSADFERSKKNDARDILKDVAVVLRTYMERMIIEAHTDKGEVEPEHFWSSVAKNRANLICVELAKGGVPAELLTSVGVSGGGAGVLIKTYKGPMMPTGKSPKLAF
jgi:hypothetical protein